MKVYEIITEDKATASIFGRLFGSLLDKMGINLAEKALVTQATERLAQRWADDILRAESKGVQVTYTDARAFLKAEGISAESITKIMGNGKLLKDLEKEAVKIAKNRKFDANWGKAKSAFGPTWDTIYTGANLFGVGEAVLTCVSDVYDAYQSHQNKEPGWEDPAVLRNTVQAIINTCVYKLTAQFAGTQVLKGIFGAKGVQKLPFMSGEKISAFYNGLSAASRMAFVVWLDTPAGRDALAKWITGEALLTGTQAEKLLVKGFVSASTWFAGFARYGVDKILQAVNPNLTPLTQPSDIGDILPGPRDKNEYDWLAPKGRDKAGRPL